MTFAKGNVKRMRYVTREELQNMRRWNSKIGDPGRKCHDQQQLLPRIPDALTISEICTKLSWTVLNSMTILSHGWLQAIQSREIFEAKRFCGAEQVVFIFQVNASEFAIYSEEDGSIYYLPEIPGLRPETILDAFTYSSLDGRLYVMGSVREKYSDPSLERLMLVFMYVYDLAGHIGWRKCAVPNFDIQPNGSAVMNGKLFVYGRPELTRNTERKSAIYDPDGDVWSPITNTNLDHLKVLIEMQADLSWYGFWAFPSYFPYFYSWWASSKFWEELKSFWQVPHSFQGSLWRSGFGHSGGAVVPVFCSTPLGALKDCAAIESWRGVALTVTDGRFLKFTQRGFDVFDNHTNTWIPFKLFMESFLYHVQCQLQQTLFDIPIRERSCVIDFPRTSILEKIHI